MRARVFFQCMEFRNSVVQGNLCIIQALLQGADVSARQSSGWASQLRSIYQLSGRSHLLWLSLYLHIGAMEAHCPQCGLMAGQLAAYEVTNSFTVGDRTAGMLARG